MTSRWVGVTRQIEESPHSRSGELERIGEIVRCLRRCELEMTNEFCPHLSLRLDLCLALEQCIEEGQS